jgi:N-acyl-D-amino-acid deacylase
MLAAVGTLSLAPAGEMKIRIAARKTISLLETTSRLWTKNQQCVSCHHQVLPMMAFEKARRRGIALDEQAARAHAAKVFAMLGSIDEAVQGTHFIDPGMGDGYMLLGADAAGIPPSLTTGVYARRIASFQKPDGHWNIFDMRPPHSYSEITATAAAARAVATHLPAELPGERQRVVSAARRWLEAAPARSSEELSFRLLGLLWTGAAMDVRREAAQELLSAQRSDGGWAQTIGRASDAYATGQALVALAEAGGVAPASEAYRQGVRFLLSTQAADGSWEVKTRLHSKAPISPPYFETGFPYGRSQVISCAGSSWALMALLDALPEVPNPVQPLAVPEADPRGEETWMRAALFGPPAALQMWLDGGTDPNSKTREGTTMLMMAAPDQAKVKLLLDRKTAVNAKARSGFDALIVAALYRNATPSVRLLLDAGAPARPGTRVTFNASALFNAVTAGNREAAEMLIARGADPRRKMLILGMIESSPLMSATVWGDSAMIRLLAAKGVDVNEQDGLKMSALHRAWLNHRDEVVRTLLELGAQADHKDSFGMIPADHASAIEIDDPATVAGSSAN